MQDDKLDLDKVLKKSHKLIPAASREANEIIALIGNTGCGKSTLLKFLTKDKSLKIIKNAQEQCIYVDSQKTIGGVGSESFESKTLLPNVVKDEESGCTIVDCAGFNDTRSSEMDFIASFMNNEYLKMAKRIKIVIVENGVNFDLNLNRDAFVKNLMQISLLLKFNFSLLKSSICIIANKVDSKFSDEKQIEFIQKFLEELKNFITKKCGKDADFEDDNCQRALQILSYLQDGCIGILRRPSEVTDDPLELDDLKQNHIDLRKLIFEKLQYADNACDKFNITVAPTTRIWINRSLIDDSYVALKSSLKPIVEGLKNTVNEKLHNVSGELKEKISSVISVGREILEKLENIKSEEDVISLSRTYSQPEEAEELNFCLRKLKFIYGVVGNEENEIKEFIVGLIDHRKILIEETANIVEFYEMMTDFVKETSRYDVLLKKDEILDRINSMSETNFQTELLSLSAGAINLNEKTANRVLNMKKISRAHLDSFKCYLRNSLIDNFSISLQNSCCIIRGKYIILSQQQEYLQKNRQQTRQIVMEATQVFFIDCDLTLENTHLILVAPLIEIVKEKRVIKFLGESGAQHEEMKARPSKNDTPGANGLHGNPGFSSGNFKLIALDVRNPELLEILSQGGDGSDGQDGGDGYSISSAIPVLKRYQVEAKTFKMDEYLRKIRADYHDVEIEGATKSTYKAGKELPVFDIRLENHPELEKEPSDGGRGGDAGPSAAAGDVEVWVKNTSAKNQVAIFRQDGKNGNAGKGGVGGEARGMFRLFKCTIVPCSTTKQEEEADPEAVNNALNTISQVAGTALAVTLPTYKLAAIAAGTLVSSFFTLSKSKTFLWKVLILNEGESGKCSCVLPNSYDGTEGHPAPGNSEQRFKFMDRLLDAEDIKRDFAAFSTENGNDNEEDCQQLIQSWNS